MRDPLASIIERLETTLEGENRQRDQMGAPPIPFGEVRLIGQFGLFANEALDPRLKLRATLDVDAILSERGLFAEVFRQVLKECGYEYDELSLVLLPVNKLPNRRVIFRAGQAREIGKWASLLQ